MRIYLDVCCLNRPFDDQAQDKVRLESEAVLTILSRGQIGIWSLLGSEVIDIEVAKISDNDRRQKVELLYSNRQCYIIVDDEIENRARKLENLGFALFDALHIACAEKGQADILLTTDNGFIRRALRSQEILKVKVENPVRWLMEKIEDDFSNVKS